MDKVKILSKYIPEEAAFLISRWIDYFKCDFKVSGNRNTKFGDFRPGQNGENDRISVNYDLNSYAFLITTVHEFAHLVTWKEHKGRVKPHGAEWKLNFRKMMQPFFEKEIFPDDLHKAVTRYLANPAASSCSDISLFRALKKYDRDTGFNTVESLPVKTVFMLKDGRTFQKGHLLRKRYSCKEINSGRVYLFNPMAEVFPVK